jgi:hypothetical protein
MTFLAALRAYWPASIPALLLPPMTVLLWMLSQPVVYEARAVVQARSDETATELVLWLTSRTVSERIGAHADEGIAATRSVRDAKAFAVDVTARAASGDRAVALASAALDHARSAVHRREQAASESRRAWFIATLRQLALTKGEAAAVAKTIAEASRAEVDVVVIDAPAAGPLPRVRWGSVVMAGVLGTGLAVAAVSLPAWVAAARRAELAVAEARP